MELVWNYYGITIMCCQDEHDEYGHRHLLIVKEIGFDAIQIFTTSDKLKFMEVVAVPVDFFWLEEKL